MILSVLAICGIAALVGLVTKESVTNDKKLHSLYNDNMYGHVE